MIVLLASCVILIATMVQTVVGFGLALISVPILVLLDHEMVPAPIVLIAFVQLFLSSWSHRAHIQWRPLLFAFAGRIPGTLLAVWAMTVFGMAGIQIFIGLSVLLAVALSISSWQVRPTNRAHTIAGFFSGFTGTTTAIGGPPIALLYQRESGDSVRGNLSAYFLIGSVMSLAGMAWAGYVTTQSFVYAAYFLPATLIGYRLGVLLKHRLKPDFMRPAVLGLCTGAGLLVLWQALLEG